MPEQPRDYEVEEPPTRHEITRRSLVAEEMQNAIAQTRAPDFRLGRASSDSAENLRLMGVPVHKPRSR